MLDDARRQQLFDALRHDTVTTDMQPDLAKLMRMPVTDESAAAWTAYFAAHARARKRRRRDRQTATADGTWPHWTTLVAEVGPACALCGADVVPGSPTWALRPTVDHVIPLADGGEHTRDNAQLAHLGCNSRKGTWL